MQIELSSRQLSQLIDGVAAKVADIIGKRQQMPQAMNIKAVCRYIGKCDRSVRTLMRADKSFPVGRKIGGEYRFDRDEVKKYWEQKRAAGEGVFFPKNKSCEEEM